MNAPTPLAAVQPDATHVFHRQLHHGLPVAVSGQGIAITDASGKVYLDASGGAAVSCLGHGHPDVIAAMHAQIDQLSYAHTSFFTTDVTEARFRIAAWQRSRESVVAQMAALEKLRRGQQLGEIDLADLLLGENLVHGAFRLEAEARAEAMRAITELRIDAHDLWLAD